MNAEQFKQWRELPETKFFFRYLWHCRLMAMEEWASRGYTNDDSKKGAESNAFALGGVKVLTSLLDVTTEDIEFFYQQTGGIGEFQYQARRENHDQKSSGMDAPGPA